MTVAWSVFQPRMVNRTPGGKVVGLLKEDVHGVVG